MTMKQVIMMRQSQFFVFLLLCLARSNVLGQDCVWKINNDLPEQDPLYITEQNELVIPDSGGLLTLKRGAEMWLVCSGNRNLIKILDIPSIKGACGLGNKLIIRGQAYTLLELECKDYVSHNLTRPNNKCAYSTGEYLNLGFNHIPLISICYNTKKESILFSKHILHGKAIKDSKKGKSRFRFRSDGLKNPRETPQKYIRNNTGPRFADLLGEEKSQFYINERSFLARGHLAPVADFLMESWSIASFYYVNAAPQWQVINNGNWKTVEKMTRKIAEARRESLSIYTGTHGVLQLPNEFGYMVDIYLLDNNELPVPKYFWKLIHSPARKEGIVFITLNNPFLIYVPEIDRFCPNICQETKWYHKDWFKIAKGFTFCCSVETFTRVVNILPTLEVHGNLEGSSRAMAYLYETE